MLTIVFGSCNPGFVIHSSSSWHGLLTNAFHGRRLFFSLTYLHESQSCCFPFSVKQFLCSFFVSSFSSHCSMIFEVILFFLKSSMTMLGIKANPESSLRAAIPMTFQPFPNIITFRKSWTQFFTETLQFISYQRRVNKEVNKEESLSA